MNSVDFIKTHILELIQEIFKLDDNLLNNIDVKIEFDQKNTDLSTNAAMALTRHLQISPSLIAKKIKDALLSDLTGEHENPLACHIENIEIAGPGFINIQLNAKTWHTTVHELFAHPKKCFQLDAEQPIKNYLVEFVSANPTGPLSIAHGRNAIIGDVLCRILKFLGHNVTREFYINDAGSQIDKLAASLKARCLELSNQATTFPEDGYAGEYIIEHANEMLKEYCFAKECLDLCGCNVGGKSLDFFKEIGTKRMLKQIKKDLENYGVSFDVWFSEASLHKTNKPQAILEELFNLGFVYEQDNCTWFRSTAFGDDKDRVIKKTDGSFTYIAPDIAYHKNKFERKFDVIINILGQDHHSYAKRLKAAMEALGFDVSCFHIILYQLVSMKYNGETLRMSKRAGVFEALSDVIQNVGTDVARYFFLNKKADAHLEFDLELAQSKDMNNPVYYLQYAYVRAKSVLKKACLDLMLGEYAQKIEACDTDYISELHETPDFHHFSTQDIALIKKVCSLRDILAGISSNFQTHQLATYAHELAAMFNSYYNANKIVDTENLTLSKNRLIIVKIVKSTLSLTLDLLGLSKPEKM